MAAPQRTDSFQYQRELSRVGKERARQAVRARETGPERYLSLAALESVPPPRRWASFMGEHGSQTMDFSHINTTPTRRDVNRLSQQRRDRVASDAQRLLDELNGNFGAEERLLDVTHGTTASCAAGDEHDRVPEADSHTQLDTEEVHFTEEDETESASPTSGEGHPLCVVPGEIPASLPPPPPPPPPPPRIEVQTVEAAPTRNGDLSESIEFTSDYGASRHQSHQPSPAKAPPPLSDQEVSC